MPIVLKYGSPGAILGAGYAAGVGKRQNDQQHDLLGLWQQGQQQQFQAGQNYLGRQQQAQMQAQAFTQQAEQNKLGRDFQAGQRQTAQGFQAEQADLQRTFQQGQQDTLLGARSKELAANRQQQMMHDFDVQALEGVRRGQLELPPAAQKRLDQLDAGLVDAMKLGPAEQDEFYKKYQDEKRSLLRTAQPTRQVSYGDRLEQFRQTLPEEHRGLPLVLDEKGNGSVLPGFKQPDPAAQQAKQAEKYQTASDKYAERVQKESQGLADANVPAKGQPAKSSRDFVDEAKLNLAAHGFTAPRQPATQPVGNPPASQPVSTPAPPAAQPVPVPSPMPADARARDALAMTDQIARRAGDNFNRQMAPPEPQTPWGGLDRQIAEGQGAAAAANENAFRGISERSSAMAGEDQPPAQPATAAAPPLSLEEMHSNIDEQIRRMTGESKPVAVTPAGSSAGAAARVPIPDTQSQFDAASQRAIDEFNRKAKTLKPGEGVYGPDGKYYTKR